MFLLHQIYVPFLSIVGMCLAAHGTPGSPSHNSKPAQAGLVWPCCHHDILKLSFRASPRWTDEKLDGKHEA